MTTAEPGQVVEVNGLPYLVLGKTKTEYEVGTKVLVECEDLIVDPATSTVGIKGIELVGQGNGHQVDTLSGLLGIKSTYSHSRCMQCKTPPVIDVQWADGRGRAWFCFKCFEEWSKQDREIVRAWYLPDREVPKKIGDGRSVQVCKLGEHLNAKGIADRLQQLAGEVDEKAYSSVIVALVPHIPIATRLAQSIPGSLPVSDLHVTLIHLGKARSLAQYRDTVEDILTELATVTPPIRYKIHGHGRFMSVGDNAEDAVYATIDSPQLPDLFHKLTQAMEAAGIEPSKQHGFIPHMTLAYTKDKKWAPDIKPAYGVADRLVLFWAGEQRGFDLRGKVGYVRKRQGKKGVPRLGRDHTRRGRWRTLRDGRHVRITGGPSSRGRVGTGYGFPSVMVGNIKVSDATMVLSEEEWGELATPEDAILSAEAFDGIVHDLERMPAWMQAGIRELGVVPETGPKFTAGGETFTTGMINARRGSVTVYNGNRYADQVAQGGLAHEAGHTLWHQWSKPAAKEAAFIYAKHEDWYQPDASGSVSILAPTLTPKGREEMRKQYPKAYYYGQLRKAISSGLHVSGYGRAWAREGNPSETFCDMLGIASQFGERFLYAHATEFNKGKDSSGLIDAFVGFVGANAGDRSGSVRWSLKSLIRSKDMPSTSVDTKKGRWVTVRGRPIFIAKARGTSAGPGGATRFDKDRWGAMAVGDRRDKWESMTESQRDTIADASVSIPDHQESLTSHAGARPDLQGDDVAGAIDSRIDSLVTKNGEDYVPVEDAALIKSTVHEFDSVLAEAGLTPAQRHALTMEAADALVAQDREAMGRTLGDHGIYHLKGNIDNTMGILEAHPDADPAETRAAAYVANIFHDTGYMAPPAQMFLDAGHPRWSQQHYDENLRPLVKDAFGGRFAGNVSHLIRTHDSTNINWGEDMVGSAVRVADNVALFQSQKLPALFRHVPGSTGILEQLAAKRINAKTAQQMLRTGLEKTKLSPSIKTQLGKGIPEVFGLTPKFTLGMLGGDILGFGWSDGALTVRLGRNADADRLQKVLDLGQRQFAKFAKTYGVDPESFTKSLQFEFKGKSGQTVLRSTIEEMKALMDYLIAREAQGLSTMVEILEEEKSYASRWHTLSDGRLVVVVPSAPGG